MLSKEIRKVLEENKKYTDMFEEYDRTGVFPLEKTRRSFTLKQRTVQRLKELSMKSGKNMSEYIDFLIDLQ